MGVAKEPPPSGLSDRAKLIAAVVIGVLYAIGMSIGGNWFPGVVGGVLAGILCFLVLRAVEQQRAERRRRRDGR
jgi:hypothetical protein